MDSDHHRQNSFSFNKGSISNLPHHHHHHGEQLNAFMSSMTVTDDNEEDLLNDETFGDCDLESVKKKSDFGPNGEFLGNQNSLPTFFQSDNKVSTHDFLRPQQQQQQQHHDDQSHQPSIDALLGEDPMRFSSASISRRSNPANPLFSMAISQANDSHRPNPYLSQVPPMNSRPVPPSTLPHPHPPVQQQQQHQPQHQQHQQQTNYQLLKQFEQMLINKQVPPQERLIYIKAMMEKMQRESLNAQQRQYQQQQPTARMMNYNSNSQDSFPNRGLSNPLLDVQRQQQQQREASMRSLAIGEMMERARLAAAAATNPNRSQSPSMVNQTAISTQIIDAMQRSEQIHISETNTVKQQSAAVGLSESPSSPLETNVSPTSRANRAKKSYPRPPLLNTWQSRGSDYDEFAGLMTDREKQWVVKIQLHQVTQTEEEDYYFHKWSQQKRHMQQVHGNQTGRSDQRTQYISYPVLQLLKSIQQEKELAQRTCQSSISNLNPSPAIPYASALTTQLGKQSTATPRHPKCILHLDGEFAIGTRANAITHDKYTLGLLLNIENIYRDILRLDNDADEEERAEKPTTDASATTTTTTTATTTPNSTSSVILDSIIDRYLNHSEYLFADMFAQFNKGQILLERLYPYLITTISTSNHLELMLIRLYGSLNYMVRCWSTTFHIEPIVMNMISLMQQQVNVKKTTFEQLLAQIYSYYDEQIKPKLSILTSTVPSSPFSDPILFTNPHTITILIELLLTLERRCYLLSGLNSSTLPVQLMQQLQPQLQYQLSEHVRLLVTDLCQALVNCSTPKKMFKPFAQVQQQQFVLLCKFLRIQIPSQTYAALEGKLIVCCIKDI